MSQPELDLGTDADPEGTYTVTQLGELINRRLKTDFDDGFWVRGEIQGWNARGAHAYFSLADDQSDTTSVIEVAVFAPSRNRLRPMLERHKLRLGDGIKVRIYGQLDFYAQRGQLKLVMTGIDPRFTLGDLSQQRHQVMRRLAAEGLLDVNRRRQLSPVPLRIGVVTSVGSAAWHDFEQELAASGIAFQLSVCDVRVQGERAEAMVAAAVATLGRRPLDAVVVIRGGGARNELAVFDAERIARAIVASGVPVLTGLGHETDRSVADEVAHTSFKTPTACAQALVAAVADYGRSCEQVFAGIRQAAGAATATAEQAVSDRAHRIARRTHAAVGRAEEGMLSRQARLLAGAQRPATDATRHLHRLAARLAGRAPQALNTEQRHLDMLVARTRALDPVVMLARGWSITRSADGRVLRDAAEVDVDDTVVTQLAVGSVTSRVEYVHAPTGANPKPTETTGTT
ncbi:exodeoxyribonuclease VII large subunit [soil metagenome]